LPKPMRWAETRDGRTKLAALRSALNGWKGAGYDVSELEDYLKTPDMTREGVDSRLRALLKTITDRMRGGATRSYPPECPKCFADLTSKDVRCPSCGARIPRPAQAAPALTCPQCKSRVKPTDRKCPTCGHRLRPWSLFS